MQLSSRVFAFALLSSFCLISHGQDDAKPVSPPSSFLSSSSFDERYSALNGNWHLTGINSGAVARRQLPFLSFSIEVKGNKLYGKGDDAVQCTNPSSGQIGGTLVLSGQIAADGTFEADDPLPAYNTQIKIHGTVPAPGATTWQGSYTLKNSSDTRCIVDQSGTFAATRYPPFNGSYSGTVTGKGFESGVTATVQVTQGEPGFYSREGFIIPLGGQIAVSGSSCFSTGTLSDKRSNDIRGDKAFMNFLMDDGSLLLLFGDRFLDGSSESTIQLEMSVEGGRCNEAVGYGTFTLQ